MALIGTVGNQGAIQGEINSANGNVTGVISSAEYIGGDVVGIQGPKGDKGDPGERGEEGHSPVLTSEKYGTTTFIYSDGDELAQIEDGATIDVKVYNKLSASDTTAYNSIVANGVAQLHPGLLGNVGVVMEATDTAASQAMKHLMFKSDYSSGMRLADGGIVLIKFMADVYNSATLNLHLQDAAYTGDVPIYDNGSAITMGKIMENDIVALMYDDRNTRFNVISKVYKAYTSTSQGLVPSYGTVYSDEFKILTSSGWQTILNYGYSSLDALLESKATLASPTFTGTPTAPTAASGTDTTQIATTAFVQDAISGIGGGDVTDVTMPKVITLATSDDDVLELSGGDVAEGIDSVSIVDQNGVADIPLVTTTNEGVMSAADKVKLNGIASGAEANVQADWSESSSSSDAYIQNKPTIPSKVSDLTNDSGFLTLSTLPVWNGGVV